MEHNDFAAARPLLESYVIDYVDHPSAAWAAYMLVDILIIRMTDDEDDSVAEALLDWIARLETMPLYQLAEARDLREITPVLRAGAMWRQGIHTRDRGVEAWRDPNFSEDPRPHFIHCAEIFLDIRATFVEHDRADTLLWHTADCFDAAKLLRAADELAQNSQSTRAEWEVSVRKASASTPYFFRGEREAYIRKASASIAFHELELELEAHLVAGPDDPEALERAEILDEGYAALVEVDDLDIALLAHARRALIWEQLANAGLVRHEGACVPLTRADNRLAERATQAYRACLDFAVEHAYFNDAARHCERALTTIDPEAAPPASELVTQPEDLSKPKIESVGVVAGPWLPNYNSKDPASQGPSRGSPR